MSECKTILRLPAKFSTCKSTVSRLPEKENLEATIQRSGEEADILKGSIRKITNTINTGELSGDERIRKIEERIAQQEQLHKTEKHLKDYRNKLRDCITHNNNHSGKSQKAS